MEPMKQCPECGGVKSIVESTIAKAGESKDRPAVEQALVCASCNAVFLRLSDVEITQGVWQNGGLFQFAKPPYHSFNPPIDEVEK